MRTVEELGEYRINEDIPVDVERIYSELERYEAILDEFEKDEEILEKAKLEIERLLKENLYERGYL